VFFYEHRTNTKRLDAQVQNIPDDSGIEFWSARDLREPLEYARWENFMTAIQRTIESCETMGYKVKHQFPGQTHLNTWMTG
jgi:DNA-damage-inducible protein D